MNRITETILVAQVRHQNSAEAFAKLYDEYVKRVYRFVYFKVKTTEDAEDVTAEIFLKTWNYIRAQKKDVGSFSGLMYRIARTTIIDWYRKQARLPETITTDQEDQEIDGSDKGSWVNKITDTLDHQRLLQALDKLKHDYQEIVVLRYIEDFSLKEIAEITGKSALSVRVTLHRALKKLEEFLPKIEVSKK
jgi:RNA polymerase sigma-70 factor (ECF subfamily)